MSVRQEVLSELETKLTTLVDAFGKYMADVVSEKSIKMEDDKEEDVDVTDDDVDATDDDSKDDSTDDSTDDDKKTVDEKQKKSKK